jgi:hypothetical protein
LLYEPTSAVGSESIGSTMLSTEIFHVTQNMLMAHRIH